MFQSYCGKKNILTNMSCNSWGSTGSNKKSKRFQSAGVLFPCLWLTAKIFNLFTKIAENVLINSFEKEKVEKNHLLYVYFLF